MFVLRPFGGGAPCSLNSHPGTVLGLQVGSNTPGPNQLSLTSWFMSTDGVAAMLCEGAPLCSPSSPPPTQPPPCASALPHSPSVHSPSSAGRGVSNHHPVTGAQPVQARGGHWLPGQQEPHQRHAVQVRLVGWVWVRGACKAWTGTHCASYRGRPVPRAWCVLSSLGGCAVNTIVVRAYMCSRT